MSWPSGLKDVSAKTKEQNGEFFSTSMTCETYPGKAGEFCSCSDVSKPNWWVFLGTVFITLVVSLLSCTCSVQNISSSDNLLLFSWQPAPPGFGASRGCQKDVAAPAHSDFSFSGWVSIILNKDFPLPQIWEGELVTPSSKVGNLVGILSFKRKTLCQPKELPWQDTPLPIPRLPLK